MTTTLLRNGTIHSPADPFATAMVVEDGTIAWIGAEGAADAHLDSVDEVIDLRGALVTPAFVDAHVHATATGLTLTGLDLSAATSVQDLLRRLEEHSRSTGLRGPAAVVLGQGWDDTRWPEGRPPTPAELDAATGGAKVYLSRVDVHSAVVSPALIAAIPEFPAVSGYQPDAPATGTDHHLLRAAAFAALTPEQRETCQRAVRARAAELGIASLHECGGPDIAGEADFRSLLALAAAEKGPEVVGYWGQAVSRAQEAKELLHDLGAHGLGGDLFADGSMGSRTACMSHAYSDQPDNCGSAYLTREHVARHVAACTEAGIQAGFHAIGDVAVANVVGGMGDAAQDCGITAVRALRHRVEHLMLPDARTISHLADLGVVASVQPGFDAAWGGSEGMYAQRLGAERAAALNPFGALNRAGVPLAFGSDAPVTPLDPWGTVRAAAFHQTPEQRISVRAAFAAHTRGGHRAVGRDSEGVLVPGAVASYAVWRTGDLVVQAPDSRVSGWSTDPGSGTPGLPDLTPGVPLPVCLRTAVRGVVVHEAEGAFA